VKKKTKNKSASLQIPDETKMFRQLAENSSDIIFHFQFKPKPHYLYVSSSVKKILGYTPADFYKDPMIGFKILHPDDRKQLLTSRENLVKNKTIKKTVEKLTAKYITKSGKVIWIENRYTPVYKGKEVVAVHCVGRDVTEQKQKEEELNQRWLNYRNLIEALPTGIFIHVNGKIIFGNKEAYKIADLNKNQNLSKISLVDYLLPKDKAQGIERIRTAMAGKDTPFVEYNIVTKKGNKKVIRTKSSPILYNATRAVQIILQDITHERKLEEERVKAKSTEQINMGLQKEINMRIESEQKLKAIFESSAHLIWTLNKNSEIISYNKNYAQAVKKLCGTVLKPRIKATRFKWAFTKEDYITLRNAHKEAFKGNATKIEIPLHAIDGKTYYREMHFYPISINGKIDEIAAVAQDTTERRNYEKQITEQSAKLKAVFDSGEHRIWTVDKDFVFTSFNKKFINSYKSAIGQPPAVGQFAMALVRKTPKYNFWEAKYKKALEGQSVTFENTYKLKNGTVRYEQVFLNPIRNEKKEVVEVAAISEEITERKAAEQKITEQSAKLKAIFDSGNQSIWTVDKNFKLTSFNNRYAAALAASISTHPSIGMDVLNLKNTSYHNKIWKEKYSAVLRGESIEFEHAFVMPNGNIKHNQVFLHPIYNEKKEVVEIASSALDITERKTAEQKITEQAARLNTIFNSGNQLMWTVNKNIVLTSFNKNYSNAIEEMYGVLPEINTVLNKPKKTFASKEYHKFWAGKYQEVFKNKKSIEFNTERTTLAGKKIYRHIFLHPIFNDKKEVTEVSGIGYDITGQQVAQEQIVNKQSQLAAIINTTGDIIFSVDKQCRLVEFNNVLENVIKKRHGVQIKPGVSIFDVLPDIYHREVKNNYRKAFMGQSSLAIEIFYMDGVKKIYEAHYKPIIINDQVTGAAVFSKDITEQERAKQEIITKQFQLSAIINTTNDIILSLDKNLNVVEFNNVMKDIAELRSGKEMKSGDYFLDFLPKDMCANLKKTYKRALGGESIQAIESFIHPKTKQLRIYSANYNPINISGEVVGIAIFSRDITEQKLSEEEVLNKQSRLSAIINNTRDIILSIDKNYNLIEFNDALRAVVKGAADLDLTPGMPVFKIMHTRYHKQTREIYERVFKGESVTSTESFGEGERKVVLETRYNPIKTGNNITGIAIFSSDITAQKNSEEDILKSLKEKEILLKEIHHRVKNNLQVISSILNLQTAYLKDKHTINILKECQNRIKTMAFIHESLYQNKDFSQINFSEYIVTLVKNLFYSFEANQQKIRANFDVEPILLNLDTSIPCGLIVNELVSNALKYAFTETKEGAIFVELKKENGKIKMLIADNGKGIPDEINYKNTETLGLQLVNTLTEQINGTISMKQNKGTIFEIIF
jgi:PAS domain S-box-containing protein